MKIHKTSTGDGEDNKSITSNFSFCLGFGGGIVYSKATVVIIQAVFISLPPSEQCLACCNHTGMEENRKSSSLLDATTVMSICSWSVYTE